MKATIIKNKYSGYIYYVLDEVPAGYVYSESRNDFMSMYSKPSGTKWYWNKKSLFDKKDKPKYITVKTEKWNENIKYIEENYIYVEKDIEFDINKDLPVMKSGYFKGWLSDNE